MQMSASISNNSNDDDGRGGSGGSSSINIPMTSSGDSDDENSLQTIFSKESSYRSLLNGAPSSITSTRSSYTAAHGRQSSAADPPGRHSRHGPVPPLRAFRPLEALAECAAPTEGGRAAAAAAAASQKQQQQQQRKRRRRRRRRDGTYHYYHDHDDHDDDEDGSRASYYSSNAYDYEYDSAGRRSISSVYAGLSNGSKLVLFGAVVYLCVFLSQREVHFSVRFGMHKRGQATHLNGDLVDRVFVGDDGAGGAGAATGDGDSINSQNMASAATTKLQRRQKGMGATSIDDTDRDTTDGVDQALGEASTKRTTTTFGLRGVADLKRMKHHNQQQHMQQRQQEGKDGVSSELLKKAQAHIDQLKQQQKQQQQQEVSQQPQHHAVAVPSFNWPLRILSLGGSNTWGSQLEERSAQSYPSVLSALPPQGTTTTNVAIRATGSDYAAMCLQTMIIDGHAQQNPSDLDEQGGSDVDYDVITVEYSMNGVDGVPLLVRRLRDRYPKALIVYVHLWSLRNNLLDTRTGKTPRDILKMPAMKGSEMEAKFREMLDDASADWTWEGGTGPNPHNSHEIRLVRDGRKMDTIAQNVLDVGGQICSLPLPATPREAMDKHLFASDAHHLSAEGHSLVANGTMTIVNKYLAAPEMYTEPIGLRKTRHPDPTWGDHGGDQCSSWFDTGTPDHTVHSGGGQIRQFVRVDPGKYAHEISKADRRPAFIEFDNKFDQPVPVGITTMVWGGEGSGKAAAYPKANVLISRPGGTVEKDGEGGADGSIHLLDPVHLSKGFRVWHVTQTHFVGYAAPGKNVLTVVPFEQTEQPLRITGIVMCGACGLEEQQTHTGGHKMELISAEA